MIVDQIAPAIQAAKLQAAQATQAFLDKHGDRDCCGFSWVTVYDVKLSTKAGKAFAASGFSKAYGGGIQLWNPSKSYTQSITALEEGSEAFAKHMRTVFPDLKIYAGSRMD